ncbi:MAG: cytochrome-c oxidase, cbb3-type subunit I [Candidatus Neomarinimicrobiota bacterium]
MTVEKFSYDNQIVRLFLIATVVTGIVGFLVGLVVALQLVAPGLNLSLPFTTFGRIRPLHTNAVIFAFVGNAVFLSYYYAAQRLLKTRNYSDLLARLHFWGWQLVILSAVITLPLGLTTGKEYAELEWMIDILIAVVWVIWGIQMLGTLLRRREKHLYVALWFYIATFITVALLHIVNSLVIPVSLFKSYPIYAGVQDALVQWWYGHNAVAFFLTTPFLGLMYYFIPKAANRPIYSYRLSIIHFWALIFVYIWAGPHHLLYTAIPDWAQSLGTVFSIMLIAPSWGGMLNGLLTLRGAWDRVRRDPVLKFFVVAVTAYGMATLEGPALAFKNVNALAHYTDWIIAHVHVGALGWNGFLIFGMLYWLTPRLYGTQLYSTRLAHGHFWVGTLGILFYVIPMYWSGITQGLMWKQFTPEGFLLYPIFLETTLQIIPMYAIRAIGGALYLTGAALMVYNLVQTARQGSFVADEEAEAPPLRLEPETRERPGEWHSWLESRPVQFSLIALVAVLIGTLAELVPMFAVKSNVATIPTVTPYSPLELSGRDLYIREGCYNCHSQMIRPFKSETERYGQYSRAGEFVYDHPFQWGSKRTGPDLAREGEGKLKKPDAWHYAHMLDPTSMSPGSIMPRYPWLISNQLDIGSLAGKIEAMQRLGVPYADGYAEQAPADLTAQAVEIAGGLEEAGITVAPDREIIALIAYLQKLGTGLKAPEAPQP